MAVRVIYAFGERIECGTGLDERTRISDALSRGSKIWVDLEAPDQNEVAILSEVFHFHPLAIEDCLHCLQRPKVDEYPGYLFVVLHTVKDRVERRIYEPEEFDIFISENYVVTFHKGKVAALHSLLADCESNRFPPFRSTGFLFQRIMRTLVDEYFPVLDRIESRLEFIEQLVFQRPSQKLMAEAFALRRDLIRIRKSLSPAREVLNALLRRDQPFMTQDDRAYFLDVYDHVLRLFDYVDNLHDLLSNALEAYLSSMSNKLNEIMKVLTMISTVMMPLTLVAGIYGMNFAYMPELGWKYGYPMSLGIMVVITLIMVWYFRRKGWL